MFNAQADQAQQVEDPPPFFSVILGEVVHLEGAAQNLHDGLAGIERTVRILKDQLDRFANFQHAVRWHVEEVLAVKHHFAVRGFDKTRDQAGGCRLATAAFTHEAEGLALLDEKTDIVHRLQRPRLPGYARDDVVV